MRALLLFLACFYTNVFAATCEHIGAPICENSSQWAERMQIYSAPHYCGFGERIVAGIKCMEVGTRSTACAPAGTPAGQTGEYTQFRISGPGADLPSQACIDGCLQDFGDFGSGVKSQDSTGQWWAGYHTPNRKSAGKACNSDAQPDLPKADDGTSCPPGFVRESGQCVKSQADQTSTNTKTTETQNPDGTKTTKTTKSTTKCTQTQCTTTTTTTTTTNYNDGTPVGPSTTTTTTTTQPRGGASPAPGTPHPGSGTGTGGGTGGTGGGVGGGSGGGLGNGSTSDGSGYCEENPGSPLCGGNDHCEKYPNTLACLKKGDPGTLEAKPVHNQDVNVSSISPRSGFGPSSAACPAGTTINVNGTSITIGFDMICQFADMIRPLVIGFAWLSAAFTFFGFARKD